MVTTRGGGGGGVEVLYTMTVSRMSVATVTASLAAEISLCDVIVYNRCLGRRKWRYNRSIKPAPGRGRGGWGGGELYLTLHCHHTNESALRWAAKEIILLFGSLWWQSAS